MKYFFILTFLIIYACHSTKESNNDPDSTINHPTSFKIEDLTGVYSDTLPCADCPGVVTTINLKPDNSFVMEEEHIKKNIVYDLGKWSTTDSILKLTGNEGPRQFKIINHAEIKLLDNEGQMSADTAARLSLHRNNSPFKPQRPIPIEGVFSALGDTMNILICAMGKNYPVALAPAAINMSVAYRKAAHQKNEAVYAKLEGHFELRPSLKDTTTQDFLVVEHFERFVPGQQCK